MPGFEQAPAPERFRQSAEVNGIEIVIAHVPEQGDYELFIGDGTFSMRVSRSKEVAVRAFEAVKGLAADAASAADLQEAALEALRDGTYPYEEAEG